MEKTIKIAKLLVQICGGWLSLMSGAVSIPIAVLAIWCGGTGGFWLAVLAFVALWIIVIRTAWSNYQMIEIQFLKDGKSNSAADLEIKRKMRIAFADRLEVLRAMRQGKENQGGEVYEAQFSNCKPPIDGIVNWELETTYKCIKEHLGDAEMKLFLNDAGSSPIPDNEQYKFWKKTMMTVERAEIRLKELIQKHT